MLVTLPWPSISSCSSKTSNEPWCRLGLKRILFHVLRIWSTCQQSSCWTPTKPPCITPFFLWVFSPSAFVPVFLIIILHQVLPASIPSASNSATSLSLSSVPARLTLRDAMWVHTPTIRGPAEEGEHLRVSTLVLSLCAVIVESKFLTVPGYSSQGWEQTPICDSAEECFNCLVVQYKKEIV